MSANQQINSPSGATSPNGNQQSSPTTWTEPPWSGWIETTGDALLILEAARRGLIPRVTRRLVDSERKMITSGSVFVFDEEESGIKRWTDGFFWSPSRILGNFLLYRETDKRGAGHRGARSDSVDDHHPYNDGSRHDHHSLSRPKGETSSTGIDRHRERVLVGSLTNSYKFKNDGLMKKTFSLTIGGVAQHLISYYKIEDVEQGRLRSPSSLPELASLDISPDYLDKTHFRNPPKVEIGVDGVPRYRGEADDIDPSTSLLAAPLSTGLPLLTDGRVSDGNKRGRYTPYGSNSKRRGKGGKGGSGSQSNSPTDNQTTGLPSPSTPSTSHHTQGRSGAASATYPEQEQAPNVGVTTAVSVPPPPPPHYAPYPVAGYYGAPGVPGVPHPQQVPSPSVSSPVPPYGYSPPGSGPPYTAPQSPPDPQQAVVPPPQPYYPYYLPPHPSHPHPHPHPHYGGYPAASWHTYNGYPSHAGPAPAQPTTTMSSSAAAITDLPDKDGDTPSSGEVGGEGGSA
ncbi:hypothetical protein PISMIDRAFT_672284 [Pisolithus microcarpus 441]|uniref:cAMP-independent regulatory protein n=1 Tax=Pisolithus microcarpus 441 TaxID=765257 RepID=A0A0D0AC33_9AGAM|nr:Gti1/Pac2 family-domain-containing protein [Pisolithus microcarpus]KIK29568.1 hypothetical protein PISMIDRAFT_672284 [Pisolithus microcarpus 441]